MSYSERFDRALVLASQIHREQKRKVTDVPYVTHLLGVASLVGAHGGTEDQVIAALLHDAIEDCIGQIPEIRTILKEEFGETVLQMVEACTDCDTVPKRPWRERKEHYLERLRQKDPNAPSMLVALADKVYNAQSLTTELHVVGDEIWESFSAPREETIWYYTSLAIVFNERMPGPLTDELTKRVHELICECSRISVYEKNMRHYRA